MADVEDGEEPCALSSHSGSAGSKSGGDKMFSLKKWNAVAMWSWDVECDTCAICRVQVMDACLRCQAENKQEDCVGRQHVELCRGWGPPHHSQTLNNDEKVPQSQRLISLLKCGLHSGLGRM
ncbi:RING-box protein 2 isoform X1 [Prionailurus viverrinus]|uniref:RING-box protein 2 n=3 Tax=Felinae TaxID=338152 RepID=A0ABI7XLI7_FELCA|nr:RING-box protein 2 isoform X1 [Felis catus]XP_026917503.1 RING-box protein 2 isoform X1 [Acinonyx jubatus]XP_040336295.1 RING-box protein 2 isoform X1 [Puma yagouaroundi]XP_043451181.1 RING-box protein 2 isoform X1 [Prionailurus bengalensis]XP_045359399.1 RING-box protein 2 isoform X1 [Leopardus geoffroyi]XP_047732314.1 RING-box protein 2 isoform X1 [Prionailurus viverrinus]XP_058586060.1 RING-box protein 2 isoform X1 [Neofelis nebulosa]